MNKAMSFIIRKMPIIFVCCLVFTTIMALIPVAEVPDVFNFWDKAQHTFAFVVLAIMVGFAFPNKIKMMGIGLLLYGASIELMQTFFTVTRVGEVSDFAADCLGISIGLIFYFSINKFTLCLNKK